MTNEIILSILLTVIVITIQLYFFVKSWKECHSFSKLFPDDSDKTTQPYGLNDDNYIEDNINNSPKEEDNGANKSELRTPFAWEIKNKEPEQKRSIKTIWYNEVLAIDNNFHFICEATNKYLRNNTDTTADFSIIKDIAERVAQNEENKIEASISLPLYIGLMGTFIGVIYGIFNIILAQNASSDSIITDNSIKAFLSGVLIAMIGSLMGLFMTTVNNSHTFKKAKAKVNRLKNNYFTFLQTELLPTLENSLGRNLKEFKDNLNIFNQEFNNNITAFKGTLPAVTDNIKLQTEFIKEFKKIDIQRVANANLKIFDKLNESAEIFKSFNKYSNSISKNVLKADEMLTKLTNILDRMTDFENNIQQIGVLVHNSDENYAKVGEYIAEKLSALKDRYLLIQEFIDKSEDDIRDFSTAYADRIKAMTQKIDQEFDKSFNLLNNTGPLTKLNTLDSINNHLEIISSKIKIVQEKSPSHSPSDEIRDMLGKLINAIDLLRRTIRPSIFKPKQFIKYMFSSNGHN